MTDTDLFAAVEASTKPKPGDALKEIIRGHKSRQARAAAIKRQFVGDSGLTAPELTAKMAGLKQDFLRRQQARADA